MESLESNKQTFTYHGAVLEEAINTVQPERKPLVENFLYEKSAVLLYADDGVGKSVLTLQACMQATVKGSKVFCEFNVPEDVQILYFQMERHPDESFERIRHLKQHIPFNTENFALSVALQGIDLQDSAIHKASIKKVLDIAMDLPYIPKLVVFDPIYTLTRDGLETAPACNAITSFFRVIQLYLNCTILATSHTNRGIRNPDDASKRIGKDMYGNRFLSAFFTGSYHIEAKPEGEGSIWTLNKSSQKNLEKKIDLLYDASNYQSIFLSDGKFSKKEKLENFIKACKSQDKEFSYSDMQKASGLTDSPLRGHINGYLKDLITLVREGKQGAKFYKSI
jgi:RecA-family ATPase